MSEGPPDAAFVRMAREFPARTLIVTFGLPAFALLQLINGLVHGGSVAVIGGFAALTVALSVKLTQYHLAVYRRKTLSRRVARAD
jgi:hypothetical protein